MTEREWLDCSDATPMLEFLRGKASERKLRLFAVECCRRTLHLFCPDGRFAAAWEAVERCVEGSAREVEILTAIRSELRSTAGGRASQAPIAAVPPGWRLLMTLLRGTVPVVANLAYNIAEGIRAGTNDRGAVLRAPPGEEVRAARVSWASAESARSGERAAQAALLRDILGPLPFRPITFHSSWLRWHSGLLVSMARRIYDSRDFADMPVLADALEEAGCQSLDILSHCRQPGEHVRGCWVIDLLLGKE